MKKPARLMLIVALIDLLPTYSPELNPDEQCRTNSRITVSADVHRVVWRHG